MKTTSLALAALLLAGCGAAPTTAEFSLHQKTKAPTVEATFKGTGAIAMAFQFPEREGYSVQAVGADIEKLVVTVKTRSFLLEKVVATTTVTRSQVKNGLANVKFDQLKAGSYTVAIQALDAAGQAIGDATGTAAVTEGKVIPLAIDLRLDGASAPTDAGGGLAVTIRIIDGTAPKPTPVPPAGGAFNTNANVLRVASFSGCLFGSTTPIDDAETLGNKLGRPLDVTHTYYQFDTPFPNAETRADVAAGRVPLISFNAVLRSGAPVRWADLAAGKQDARLHEVARGLKSLGKPVFFTFNHEPENDEVRGTPAEYRAAWRHVAEVLASDGATNAVKVYICMGGRVEGNEDFYPGDDVVDWVGGDTYNWGFTASQPKANWRTFAEAATSLYTWAKAKHKPIMVGETGCAEDPADANRKAEWLKGMGATLKAWPEVKALVYFNSNRDDGKGANHWYVASAQAIAAFKQVAQDPYFARH